MTPDPASPCILRARMSSDSPAIPCPICAAASRPRYTIRALDHDWHIRSCPRCGHAFVANRPTAAELAGFYTSHPEQLGSAQPSPVPPPAAVEIARDISALTPLRGRSLDVGCGSGDFSVALQQRGFTPTLNDWSPAVLDLERYFPGGAFYQGAFEELPDPGPYDAILMSQVLEHALDPVDWLRRSRTLLAPGGVIAVALPNFTGLYRLLGRRDPFLIPPFHLNYFSGESLSRAFTLAGLQPVRLCSSSELRTEDCSGLRLAARRTINILTKPLNFTARGIMLRGYARRA